MESRPALAGQPGRSKAVGVLRRGQRSGGGGLAHVEDHRAPLSCVAFVIASIRGAETNALHENFRQAERVALVELANR